MKEKPNMTKDIESILIAWWETLSPGARAGVRHADLERLFHALLNLILPDAPGPLAPPVPRPKSLLPP